MVFVSIVTAAMIASARPVSVVPEPNEIACFAIKVPTIATFAANVTALPTCQNTPLALAPLINRIDPPVFSFKVVAIWKMNTGFGKLWPSSVRMLVICSSSNSAV
eukprot:Mycagemm_TRINITY_DN9344_c0_g1::TRINITY_DN9344_c0_g1_i1::g.3148::m.3148 type:complete len:105 gc:universal TRINITY_DN9344_c0_g1_i1:725-411(-)